MFLCNKSALLRKFEADKVSKKAGEGLNCIYLLNYLDLLHGFVLCTNHEGKGVVVVVFSVSVFTRMIAFPQILPSGSWLLYYGPKLDLL